ncbi:MAG: monovalent cation/H(+) antiporter subunit G [Pseudonocardia sediminis]
MGTVVAGILIGLGVVLTGIGAIGMLRLPDVYTRANGVTKAASLGMVVLLLGVLVLRPGPGAFVTVLAAIVLQLFTVPIAGFAIGGAAYRSGVPRAPETHHDEVTDEVHGPR